MDRPEPGGKRDVASHNPKVALRQPCAVRDRVTVHRDVGYAYLDPTGMTPTIRAVRAWERTVVSRRDLLAGMVGLGLGRALWADPAMARVVASDLPTQFIIGYGSLIDAESRAGTAGARLEAVPVRVSADFGYRRVWNLVAGSGFTALGLETSGPTATAETINGVIFPVDGPTLAKFDRREMGYDRVPVPNALIQSLSWMRLPEAGTAFIYVPKPGTRGAVPDAAHPIVQSYVDLVLGGALAYGEAFAREVVETTFGWDTFWLNDRPFARRPWSANPAAGAIDRLLATTPPAAASFPKRLLSEDYTARYLVPERRAEPARP